VLYGCHLDAADARALLAPTGLPSLTDVSLGAVSSREFWAIEPAARLRGRLHLFVDLDFAFDALEDSPLLLACHTLDAYCLDGLACRTLAATPAAKNVVSLSLSIQVGDSFTDDDVRPLARSPHLTSLRDLYLGQSHLTESCIAALLAGPLARQLTRLDLSRACSPERRALQRLARTDALDGIRELILYVPLTSYGVSTGLRAVRNELEQRYGTRVRFIE
jgi:hypothetical protein